MNAESVADPIASTVSRLTPESALMETGTGFFIEPGNELQKIWTKGREWYVTPTDPFTGLPYAIRPRGHLSRDDPQKANEHHANHPASEDALDITTPMGDAVRNSRMQLALATDHNTRDQHGNPNYHDLLYGSFMPRNEDEAFRRIIPACGGAISPYALDWPDGEPRVVRMSEEEIDLLLTPSKPRPVSIKRFEGLKCRVGIAYDALINPSMSREEYVSQAASNYMAERMRYAGFTLKYLTYRIEPVRNFVTSYILSRDMPDKERAIREAEEFLTTSNEKRKEFLGRKLVQYAIEVATEPLAPVYDEAKKQGTIHPRSPRNVQRLTLNILGPLPRQQDMLAAQLGQRILEAV